jgi:hypothetical protein
MPTNDGGKHGRGAYKIGDPLPADTAGEPDTSPDEGVGPPDGVGKRRGPYRTGDLSTGKSDADILRDPQVAAFVEALTRLRDPQQRALLEELVRDLTRQSGTIKRV